MLVKLAFYALNNAHFFIQRNSNDAQFPKLCSFGMENALFYFEEIQNKASRVCYFT